MELRTVLCCKERRSCGMEGVCETKCFVCSVGKCGVSIVG